MTHTREEELKMMQTPDDWPVWPYLPLRRVPDMRVIGRDFGLLVELESVDPVVFIRNLFDTTPVGESLRIQYDSFEALYDDGWRVD